MYLKNNFNPQSSFYSYDTKIPMEHLAVVMSQALILFGGLILYI
jgi:hypothetical protein